MERPPQLPSPVPPPPAGGADVLTATQWGILIAIADTVIPSLTPLQGNRLLKHPLRADLYASACDRLAVQTGSVQLANDYLLEWASTPAEFKDGVRRLMGAYMPEGARKQFCFVLSALSSRAGALFLTGYTSPIDCLPVRTREAILLSWAHARLPLFRQLHASLTSLVKLFWVRSSPTLGPVLSFPRTPVHHVAPESTFPFEFTKFDQASEDEPCVLETDVVIVGSGCGGAVAAKTLAEAGLKVIVVEKAYYWPPQHLPMSEDEGFNHLFAGGGALQSDDSSITVLAGSVWGGGGTVNWSASLQTQGYVRREWSRKFGLPHFTSSAYQNDMDEVCARMGVGTAAIEHNKTNSTLLEGARKLGWSAKVVPQNTGGKAHNCGYCTLGCGSCGKKGPSETFLPDAAQAGATFVEGFAVEEVLFERNTISGDKIVSGVKGTWTSRDGNGGVSGTDRITRTVIIEAPRVICSGGTIATPILLQNSGLTNPHIGRHLHLHPVTFVGAIWDEPVRPWEGSILTSVVNEFENLDGQGYGTKLEACTMLPSVWLPLLPWKGGLQYKQLAAKMKQMTGYISLARDRYGGKIYTDPNEPQRARIQYTPSAHDKAHILSGVIHLAELLYVQGAREIFTMNPHLDPFLRPSSDAAAKIHVSDKANPSLNDLEFQAWLAKLRHVGLTSPDTPYASAHQMGSCRMGASPQTSVVDSRGRVWETRGLYICDASVFPSASGVNPMVTTMGISRGIARGIAEEVGMSVGAVARPAKL
ncbi:hypothetical protein LTR62_005816 [Meristemomyces frigidus]|uniref:Long-chain-alcohol oxidase n=1 Tax=Meristemomyces frigidus TaxID=1508187 RepID=A0AAN7TP18_9PEZI|nr:hypothetical protein LTR62_005816 [Meristemomyces frigidus]